MLEEVLELDGKWATLGQVFGRLLFELELKVSELISLTANGLSEIVELLHLFWIFVTEVIPVDRRALLTDSSGFGLDLMCIWFTGRLSMVLIL